MSNCLWLGWFLYQPRAATESWTQWGDGVGILQAVRKQSPEELATKVLQRNSIGHYPTQGLLFASQGLCGLPVRAPYAAPCSWFALWDKCCKLHSQSHCPPGPTTVWPMQELCSSLYVITPIFLFLLIKSLKLHYLNIYDLLIIEKYTEHVYSTFTLLPHSHSPLPRPCFLLVCKLPDPTSPFSTLYMWMCIHIYLGDKYVRRTVTQSAFYLPVRRAHFWHPHVLWYLILTTTARHDLERLARPQPVQPFRQFPQACPVTTPSGLDHQKSLPRVFLNSPLQSLGPKVNQHSTFYLYRHGKSSSPKDSHIYNLTRSV